MQFAHAKHDSESPSAHIIFQYYYYHVLLYLALSTITYSQKNFPNAPYIARSIMFAYGGARGRGCALMQERPIPSPTAATAQYIYWPRANINGHLHTHTRSRIRPNYVLNEMPSLRAKAAVVQPLSRRRRSMGKTQPAAAAAPKWCKYIVEMSGFNKLECGRRPCFHTYIYVCTIYYVCIYVQFGCNAMRRGAPRHGECAPDDDDRAWRRIKPRQNMRELCLKAMILREAADNNYPDGYMVHIYESREGRSVCVCVWFFFQHVMAIWRAQTPIDSPTSAAAAHSTQGAPRSRNSFPVFVYMYIYTCMIACATQPILSRAASCVLILKHVKVHSAPTAPHQMHMS